MSRFSRLPVTWVPAPPWCQDVGNLRAYGLNVARQTLVERFWRFKRFYRLAERVGFEPTCPFGQHAFEARPLRPLRYLSARVGPRLSPESPIISRTRLDAKPESARLTAEQFLEPRHRPRALAALPPRHVAQHLLDVLTAPDPWASCISDLEPAGTWLLPLCSQASLSRPSIRVARGAAAVTGARPAWDNRGACQSAPESPFGSSRRWPSRIATMLHTGPRFRSMSE